MEINREGTGGDAQNEAGRSITSVLKCCVSFRDYITQINDTQIVNPKDLDIVMPAFNSFEFSSDYKKIIKKFLLNIQKINQMLKQQKQTLHQSSSKNEITCSTLAANNVKNVTIVVPLEYICIFDKTLKVLWSYSWNNMI